MTLKGAGLLLALALATGTGAAALPLSHADGLSDGTSLAQQVRHHYRWHHWHGSLAGLPLPVRADVLGCLPPVLAVQQEIDRARILAVAGRR